MTRRRPPLAFAVALVAAAPAASARAQTAEARATAAESAEDELTFGATAEVPAPAPVDRPEDPTAAVTVVRTGERPHPRETVPDLLREVPGARVPATGGVGSFAGLSLRGAELDQTATYLGELRLDGPDTGSFDLSTIPAEALDAIEVARGPSPAWWNEGAIGGVLRLIPASRPEPTLRLFGGSFGTLGISGTAGAGRDEGGPRLLSTTTVLGSRNDYPFQDDNLTPWTTEDDRSRTRRNADVLDASTLLHLDAPVGDGTVDAVLVGFLRSGGVPGPGGSDTLEARQTVRRLQGSVAHTLPLGDRGRLQAVVAGGYEARRLDDRLAELGMAGPHVYDDRFTSSLGRLAAEGALTPWLDATLVGTYRYEGFAPADLLAPRDLRLRSHRHGLAGTAEARFHGRIGAVPFELRPSARLLATWVDPGGGPQMPAGATTLAPTGRLGLSLAPAPGWVLAGSVGSGVRVPTALELFGNRVLLLGAPDLAPEHATTFDLGIAGRGSDGRVTGRLELRAFARLGRDEIVYGRSTGRGLRPENVGRTRTLGVESRGSVTVGPHARMVVAVTALDARETTLEARLPFRPRVVAYGRLEGRVPGLGVLDHVRPYGEVEGIGPVETNLANLRPLPGRAPLSLGVLASFARGRVAVGLAMRDLFDVRGVDLEGFPLPGRRFEASLTLRPGLDR